MLNLKKWMTKVTNRFGGEIFECTRNSDIDAGECFGFFDKSSGLVTLNLWYRDAEDIAVSTDIFTIPTDYIPTDNARGVGVVITSGTVPVITGYTILSSGGVRQNGSNVVRSGMATVTYKLSVGGG